MAISAPAGGQRRWSGRKADFRPAGPGPATVSSAPAATISSRTSAWVAAAHAGVPGAQQHLHGHPHHPHRGRRQRDCWLRRGEHRCADDYSVPQANMDSLAVEGAKLWPHIFKKDQIRTFAGIQPKWVDENGAIQDWKVEIRDDVAPNAVNLVGIESPA